MIDIQVLNVLSGNNIDLIIPFFIEGSKHLKLITLTNTEAWEIMFNNFYSFHIPMCKYPWGLCSP